MSAHRKPLGLTAERAAELLERDPEHGWRWRPRRVSDFGGNETICASWNARRAGKPAGSQNEKRAAIIKIDNMPIDLRRLEEELGEAIDAIASSSSGMPLDDETGGFAGDSGKLADRDSRRRPQQRDDARRPHGAGQRQRSLSTGHAERTP